MVPHMIYLTWIDDAPIKWAKLGQRTLHRDCRFISDPNTVNAAVVITVSPTPNNPALTRNSAPFIGNVAHHDLASFISLNQILLIRNKKYTLME